MDVARLATGVGPSHEASGGLWVGWPGDALRWTAGQRADPDRQPADRRIVPVHLSRDATDPVVSRVCQSGNRVLPLLQQFTASTPGSRIEAKSASVAWHYRGARAGVRCETGARAAHAPGRCAQQSAARSPGREQGQRGPSAWHRKGCRRQRHDRAMRQPRHRDHRDRRRAARVADRKMNRRGPRAATVRNVGSGFRISAWRTFDAGERRAPETRLAPQSCRCRRTRVRTHAGRAIRSAARR